MARELRGMPRQLDVHVFEANESITPAGAGMSLGPNGLRVLARLGLAERLPQDVGAPLEYLTFFNVDGSQIVSFPNRARETHGYALMGIRRHLLRQELLAAAQREPEVTLHTNHKLVDLDCGEAGPSPAPRPAVLTFANGATFEADLVVGCDGLRSRVRAAVRGADEPPPRYTGGEEVIAITRDACDDLLTPGHLGLVLGPQRSFGAFSVGGGIMWFASRRQPASPDAWGPVSTPDEQAALREELLQSYRGWTLVERMVQREVVAMARVGIFDREPVSTWRRGVATLAGDAANPVPPNLGQGGTKALEDAGVLVCCLKRLDCDVPRALDLYERLRIPRSAAILADTRRGGGLTESDNPLLVALRNTVLRALVALNGGALPLSKLWEYDTERVVLEAQLPP